MMFRRVLLRGVTAVLLAAGVIVGGARPAAAHATLLGTEPGYGVSVSPAPGRALIRYDLPVEVRGAQVTLERSGRALKVGRLGFGSPDHKDVSMPLPKLGPGRYVLTWFLFGSDGDVMGGELAFTVLAAPGAMAGAAPDEAAGTRPSRQRSFAPLSRAQDTARLAASAGMVVLLGGVTFVAVLWPAGARLRRTRLLLWASLAGALVANAAALGLKGAAVQGRPALDALSPAALTALNGTHVGRVLVARLGFLFLAVPVVALLTTAPGRALRSHRWWIAAAVAGLGVLATHGMLSHAYARGPLASAINVVHLAAVTVWLGGLVVLAAVVLPRRRGEELLLLVPRFSRLAFGSVVTAVVAGTALLVLISPRWTALPTSGYGRILLLKLALVAALLVMASRARDFVGRHLLPSPVSGDLAGAEAPAPLPVPVGVSAAAMGVMTRPIETRPRTRAPVRLPEDVTVVPAPLQPFVNAVMAELCIAASILAATALLAGRPPPT
jgi:copper transport protein